MNINDYLDQFKQASAQLDTQLLAKKKLEVETGIWLNSAVLKIYKKPWLNERPGEPRFSSAIFFSIWLNDQTINGNKLFYNIHALKLRQFKDYSFTSREFATTFRKKFKPFEDQWPNVSVDFGPLTLMEGWKTLNADTLQEDIVVLASQFIEIDYLIDTLLTAYKK